MMVPAKALPVFKLKLSKHRGQSMRERLRSILCNLCAKSFINHIHLRNL